MTEVCITGATGYVGAEITRLLSRHKHIKIKTLISHSFAGKKISSVYPGLRNICDNICEELDPSVICEKGDLFINCLPHGISQDFMHKLIENGKRVLDHSADFRFKDYKTYEKWYGISHKMTDLLEKSSYGLAELYRDNIQKSAIVSNPGCYPTCSILGLTPVLKNIKFDKNSIIIDALSGVSGAGRSTELPYQFCECDENLKAYKVASHRHIPEIEQELSNIAGQSLNISFTPHLVPLKRGMLATIYINPEEEVSLQKLNEIYRDFYKGEKFVRIMDIGEMPETKNVAGSNYIDIGFTVDTRTNRIIIVSAIDNLGKGSAGQAVQDINIMYGFEESEGIDLVPSYL